MEDVQTKQQKFQSAIIQLVASQTAFQSAIIAIEKSHPIGPHLHQVMTMKRYQAKITAQIASLSAVRVE